MVKAVKISFKIRARLVNNLISSKSWSFAKAHKTVKWLLRFLQTKIECEDFLGEKLSPGPVLDEAWHEFILDTQAYKEFCNQNIPVGCGKNFLHHRPEGSWPEEDEQRQKRHKRTLDELLRRFNHHREIYDPELFPDIPAAEDQLVESTQEQEEDEEEEDEVEPTQEKQIQIFLRRLSANDSRVLYFPPDAKLIDLRGRIEDQTCVSWVPRGQYRLLCNGHELLDKHQLLSTLPSNNVHLILRLRGC